MIARMREKGQITIPADIRETLHLSQNALLSVSRVGDAILLVPGVSVFEEVSGKFARTAEDQGISLDHLLGELKQTRRES